MARPRTSQFALLGLALLLGIGGCDAVGVLSGSVSEEGPAIRRGSKPYSTAVDSPVALEGYDCSAKPCFQGLVCAGIYDGNSSKLIGKYCFEKCAKVGQDPNCEEDEQCVVSKDAGQICFAAANPAGGYTRKSPAADAALHASQGGGGTPPDGSGGGTAPSGSCGGAEESAVFELLNNLRKGQGLSALACDLTASKVARAFSQDMCNKGYFDHTGLDGTQPWDRLQSGGVQFSSAGENIAQGYQSPQAVHDGWVGSSGHYENMVGQWTRVGIGYVSCGGSPYWTEDFMN